MTFNYCPNCGQQGTISCKPDNTTYACSACDWHFWDNPHGTATAIFLNDEHQILFAKRRFEPRKGYYDLPGGFLEYNELALDGFMREIREELDVVPLNPQLFDHVYGNEYHHPKGSVSTTDLLFVITKWKGTFKAKDDVAAFEWMPIEAVESSIFAWTYAGFTQHMHEYIAKHGL